MVQFHKDGQFHRKDNFCDFLFAFLHAKFIMKRGSTLKEKKNPPKWNSFLYCRQPSKHTTTSFRCRSDVLISLLRRNDAITTLCVCGEHQHAN